MTDPQMKKVLAIIPAFNEQENIAKVIKRIKDVDTKLDILVIDDGSRDRTASVALRNGAKAITLSTHMGYGVALQTGYKYAFRKGYEFVVQIDGDGQHDPSDIPDLLKDVLSGDADLVLGSRFMKQTTPRNSSEHIQKCGFAKEIGIWLFSRLTSILVGFKITDPTSGFQAINRKVINFFTRDFFPCDYPDADVILIAYRAGFTIKEVPVIVYERMKGKSMHAGMKPAYYTFKMFLSIFMTMLRKRPPFLKRENAYMKKYPNGGRNGSSCRLDKK